MRYIKLSCNKQQLTGQAKLYKIVNRVLKSSYTFDWVSVCGNSIARVFASGPGELLDRCQRRNGRLQQDRSNESAEDVHDTQSEKVLVTPELLVCSTVAN